MNLTESLDLAKLKVLTQYGMEYLNLLLIPLIAADIIQRRVIYMFQLESSVFVWWFGLIAIAAVLGWFMIYTGLLKKESTFVRKEMLTEYAD